MNSNLLFDFKVNKETKTIQVQREFAANVEIVWEAWTNPELLDQWWAPKPFQTKTKSMDFRVGGFWLYAMVGPDNTTHWGKADYLTIDTKKSFSGLDGFCDENSTINEAFPRSKWNNTFNQHSEDSTTVNIEIQYDQLSDLEKIIEMGFKEGFTAALQNLDHYIETKFKLRSELKTENIARVCTYLNFPGNTEDAFLFYKSVFQTDFSGGGLQRFGDLPADSNHPPVADAIKNMIIHVELPILGNHILMGTDAPKEMGFTLVQGNNMHISLEPETRSEADRIFNELSAGGNITMPLEDMFFGSYFGSFTDKFGINWMINCVSKN